MKFKKILSISIPALLVVFLLTACTPKSGINGTLLGEDKQPLVNIKITLKPSGSSSVSAEQTVYTDAEGSFSFLNNPSGDYVLTILWDANPSCPSLETSQPLTTISDFVVTYAENAAGKVLVAVKEFNYQVGKDQTFKLIFPCSAQQSNQNTASNTISEGVKIKDFTFSTYDDQSYSLADYKGKVLIVNFWSSWALPCEEISQLLEQISQKYSPQDVAVFGVNYQDSEPDAQAFIERIGITYPTGPDNDEKLYKQFGVQGVPHTFIIDKSGKLVKTLPGTKDVSLESLSSMIDALIK